MYGQIISRRGRRLLNFFLVLLLILGSIVVLKLVFHRRPPDYEKHRPQLVLLEQAYRLRKARLLTDYERKAETAPNEVLAIRYQQEKRLSLDEAEDLYFGNRQAILEGDYGVLPRCWGEEIEEIKRTGVKEDEKK